MTTLADAYKHLQVKEHDSSRIPDFVLGVALAIPIGVPGSGTNLSVLAMLGAILLASTRKPTEPIPIWAPLVVVAMVGWVTFSMLYNGLDNIKQLGFFGIFGFAILAFASGRVDRISICRGIGLGLAIGAAAGLASRFFGLGGDPYPGRLTGSIWGDPNQAGYYLTVLTAVTLVGLRPGWRRWGALLVFSFCIVLTLSRTSMVAMAVGGVWFLVRRRVSPGLGLGILGGTTYLLQDASERLKNWGPFAERVGSDLLRDRIDAAAGKLVQVHPWIGRGPGTAQVDVDGRTFFFHNAYLAVRNNGGWILLTLLLVLIALTVVSLLRLPPERHHPWHEAALIGLLICAASLGEAFLRAPAALAIGLAIRHFVNPMELQRSDQQSTQDHVL